MLRNGYLSVGDAVRMASELGITQALQRVAASSTSNLLAVDSINQLTGGAMDQLTLLQQQEKETFEGQFHSARESCHTS